MAVARWFDPDKVEPGLRLPYGVPMRDLTEDEFKEYPEHVQHSIDTWPVFRKTNPHPTPRKALSEDKET